MSAVMRFSQVRLTAKAVSSGMSARSLASVMGPQIRYFSRSSYAQKSFPDHQVINMPALSPTMTQGGIGAWGKKPGDNIQPGDVLVEIETDKAQMDFEFQEEGYLAKVLMESGSKDVPVGNPIAVLVENESDVAAFADFTIEDAGGAKAAEAPKEEAKEQPKEEKKEEKAAAPKTEAPQKKADETPSKPLERVAASPIARRIASEKGIPLTQIKGSGPNGRIILKDVEAYKAPAAAAASAPAPASASAGVAFTDVPVSNMRRVIGQRLQESKQTAPHYYVTSEISMDKINKLRAALNAQADGKYKLSVNDFVIKAAAQALKEVPECNSAWYGEFIRQHHTADISVAVATPTGLITPIIKSAEARGLASISNSMKDLGKRAKDGKLKPEEYQGGSFTISNLGMFGVDSFTAIINPPQSCILAVGATKDVVVVDPTSEKGFKVEPKMKCTLSSDHRTVDGAVGAQFLKSFKKFMENPLALML